MPVSFVRFLGSDYFTVVLGGSWVVRSGVISRVTILITRSRGPINPTCSSHEPGNLQVQLQEDAEAEPYGFVLNQHRDLKG